MDNDLVTASQCLAVDVSEIERQALRNIAEELGNAHLPARDERRFKGVSAMSQSTQTTLLTRRLAMLLGVFGLAMPRTSEHADYVFPRHHPGRWTAIDKLPMPNMRIIIDPAMWYCPYTPKASLINDQ